MYFVHLPVFGGNKKRFFRSIYLYQIPSTRTSKESNTRFRDHPRGSWARDAKIRFEIEYDLEELQHQELLLAKSARKSPSSANASFYIIRAAREII